MRIYYISFSKKEPSTHEKTYGHVKDRYVSLTYTLTDTKKYKKYKYIYIHTCTYTSADILSTIIHIDLRVYIPIYTRKYAHILNTYKHARKKY